MSCLILSGLVLSLAPPEAQAFDWSFSTANRYASATELNATIERSNKAVNQVSRTDEKCQYCDVTKSGSSTTRRAPRTEKKSPEPSLKLSAFSAYSPIIVGGSCRISGRGFGMHTHPILKKTTYRNGRRVRSHVRRFHDGQDIPARRGTPIRAPMDGTIVSRKSQRGYGNAVTLKMANGVSIMAAHMSRFGRSGQVKKGDIIGYVGSTGLSTGPHLHLTVISASGQKINPKSVFSHQQMCKR